MLLIVWCSINGYVVFLGNYFLRYADHGTPFDTSLDETAAEEDILVAVGDEASGYFSEESEDESEELKQDFVDEYADGGTRRSSYQEKKEKHSSKAPILTNTALSVLRQIGKYLQMSRLLRPIAFDIIMCMTQLFDFYVYGVHRFFAADLVSIQAICWLGWYKDSFIENWFRK